MRSLKFRAWDKRFKKMVYDKPMAILFLDDGDHEIMQFTGLSDREGKEIWEGDFVLDHGYRGVVKFGTLKRLNFHGVFYLDLTEGGGTGGDAMFDRNMNVEVLGNVYENPELLSDPPGEAGV